MYHHPPPLREYQSRAVGDVLSTSEPTCLVAPTGSGKSRMGAEIAARLPGRGAWIVHRRELLRQARDLLARHGLDDRVTPVTVQSSEWPVADFVVLDELHHYMSDEWSGIFDHLPAARFIGLTATPERADGRALGDRFSRLVVAAHYSDLLRDGFLVDCRVLRPDEVLSKGLALDPVDAYLKHGEQRAGFVFVQRVSQAKEIAERFRAAGIEARAVTERCSTAERDAAIDGLASGEVRLLVNVYTLTEGVDIPHASVCILARPVGHVSQYLQIAGRILRPCPAKQDALLIDLTGASHLHGLPTEDRIYSLDGVGIRRKSQSVTTCQLCGASYESGPTACPECGFVLPHKDWKPPRVMNVELRAVYRGAATPDDAKRREYERLRAEQRATGRSVESVVVRFRDLFGEAPNLDDVTIAERRDEYRRLAKIGAQKGYNGNFAGARYKSIFGTWPNGKVTGPFDSVELLSELSRRRRGLRGDALLIECREQLRAARPGELHDVLVSVTAALAWREELPEAYIKRFVESYFAAPRTGPYAAVWQQVDGAIASARAKRRVTAPRPPWADLYGLGEVDLDEFIAEAVAARRSGQLGAA